MGIQDDFKSWHLHPRMVACGTWTAGHSSHTILDFIAADALCANIGGMR